MSKAPILANVGNPLRERWERDEPAIGGWCHFPTPMAGEVLAQLGFDWITVDQQHGLMDIETTAAMLQAISLCGAVPIVRVPQNESWLIGKALDLGAFGVIVPAVESAYEAANAARACRYPPRGNRSAGPIRTARRLGVDMLGWNDHVLCIVMVETEAGWNRLEEICATPGVDGVYLGPVDLAIALGRRPSMDNINDSELAQLVEVCRRNGVVAGTHAPSASLAAKRFEQGFRFVGLASDDGLLARGAEAELRLLDRLGSHANEDAMTLRSLAEYGSLASPKN